MAAPKKSSSSAPKTISSSSGTLTNTGKKDSRGNPVYKSPTGDLITKQGNALVLSSPAKPKGGPVTSNINTGDPALDELAQGVEGQLQSYIQGGNVLSEMIEISPDKVQEFVNQAAKEIDPYYQGIFKSYKSDFDTAVSEALVEYGASEEKAVDQFGRNLRSYRDQLSERGLAQSGQRIREEGEQATDFERALQSSRRGLQSTFGQNIRSLERKIGSANVAGVTAPALTGVTTAGFSAGETSIGSPFAKASASPLFTLTPGITGTLEEEQAKAKQLRVEQLKQAFREQEARRLYAGA